MARAATPPSQVDPVELCDFINGEKDLLKECDADVKDAKRRINAVKPKRKKGQQVETQAAEHSESEGSASVWSWFPNCLVWIYLGTQWDHFEFPNCYSKKSGTQWYYAFFKESTYVIPLCLKVDQVSFFACGKCQVLFQLQLGSQICCPFFGTLVWHKSRGPAMAAVKFGAQLQPAILWQVLCDQQWRQRNTFQVRTPRQRCEKNWQWCTATLHSTGALPNEFESDTHSPKKAKHWLMTYNITAALIRYFQ